MFALTRSRRVLSIQRSRAYHTPPAFLGLAYKKKFAMDEVVQAGQIRDKPGDSSRSTSPIGKKPRLDGPSPSEAVASTSTIIVEKFKEASAPKKSAKKLARKAKKKGLHVPPEPFSPDDVLYHDVMSVLGEDVTSKILEDGTEWDSPFDFREEVTVEVKGLSASGMFQ